MLSSAIKLATEAHEGQYRKKSNLPYITHPLAVMTTLIDYGYQTSAVLSAAVLHDVIEDCDVEYVEKIADLNFLVFSMVSDLTKDENTNFKLQGACLETQLVKVADINHNTKEVLYPKYLRKKHSQMLFLNKAWGTPLFEDTMAQIEQKMRENNS